MNAVELTTALGGKWSNAADAGSARCPAHDDQHPSLSISDGRDGRLLVHCHKGCQFDAIRDALEQRGLWERPAPEELVPTSNGTPRTNGTAALTAPTPLRREAAVYDYRDATGTVLYQTVRFAPKDFRQRHPAGDGWAWGMGGAERVLYRMPELLSTPRDVLVYIVEGEKDVERLRALGLVATCNPLGAKKWQASYTLALRGRPCVLLPDNDPTGAEHVAQVAGALQGQAASVRVVPLPDVPEHGDVSDWLDQGHTLADLEALVQGAPDTATLAAEAYPIKQIAAALAAAEATPPPLVQGLLWSGRVHWMFSAPGSGKTLLMLAAGLHIAAGQPFGGRAVQPGSVLLIEEDSPEAILGDYVQTLADTYPSLPIERLPLYYNAVTGLRLTDGDSLAKVWAAVRACPTLPVLVVIDTCEAVLPSGEFSSRELAPLRQLLQALTTAGIAVVVIDHTRKQPPQMRKDEKQAGPLDLIDLLYGGRGKSGMSDVMIYLSGALHKGLKLVFPKFRGSPPDSVVVVFDERGFLFKSGPRKARTASEQAVIKYLGSTHGWVTSADVSAGSGLSERQTLRVLSTLVDRGWLRRDGAGKTTRYQADDIASPSTLEPDGDD